MLKQLILTRKLAQKREQLKTLKEKRKELRARRAEMKTREDALEADIKAAAAEAAQEEAEAAVAEFEAEVEALETEISENTDAIEALEAEIETLETELEEINSKAEGEAAPVEGEEASARSERRGKPMPTTYRTTAGMTVTERRQYRADFIARAAERAEVKEFAAGVRSIIGQTRTVKGGDYTVPEVMLPLIREIVEERSKLLAYLTVHSATGTARQPVMGAIPEAVWTDMVANINELDLDFAQIELDGWKVAGYIPIPNSLADDNDVGLLTIVVQALGVATAKALDKAWLFGDGTRMPLGIVARLLQTAQPANYPNAAPAWVDLHNSNVQVITAANSTGLKLFQSIGTCFIAADKDYGTDGQFWAMNHKTHMNLITEAMSINANGSIVTGIGDTMPVLGGDIVEIEDIPDSMIVAGYGQGYSVLQRQGLEIGQSDHVFFLKDQTVFRAVSRYDGMPAIPDAFVVIMINGATVDVSGISFAEDKANKANAIMLNTATASVAVGAKTQLYAITWPGAAAVTWTSATPAKATVDSATGEVTGVAAGTSVITATCGGLTASCTVTVTA